MERAGDSEYPMRLTEAVLAVHGANGAASSSLATLNTLSLPALCLVFSSQSEKGEYGQVISLKIHRAQLPSFPQLLTIAMATVRTPLVESLSTPEVVLFRREHLLCLEAHSG